MHLFFFFFQISSAWRPQTIVSQSFFVLSWIILCITVCPLFFFDPCCCFKSPFDFFIIFPLDTQVVYKSTPLPTKRFFRCLYYSLTCFSPSLPCHSSLSLSLPTLPVPTMYIFFNSDPIQDFFFFIIGLPPWRKAQLLVRLHFMEEINLNIKIEKFALQTRF